MGHGYLRQGQRVCVWIFLGVDEAHIEHRRKVYRKHLHARLCLRFAKADAPAASPRDVSVAVSLFAARSQRKRMVVVEAIGLEPFGMLPLTFVSVESSDVESDVIPCFKLVFTNFGVLQKVHHRRVWNCWHIAQHFIGHLLTVS